MRAAVETLYAVFAGYPLRDWTDPCMHCHTDADERRLHGAPLRELSAGDLRQFTDGSLMVWGGLGDLKHFLPRILEIAGTEGFDYPDVEVVYGHLAYGDLPSWPAPERAAVLGFAMAHWQAVLDDDADIEALLAALMLIEDDLTPYLTVWERSSVAGALVSLGEFAEEVALIMGGKRQWNAYLNTERVLPGPAQVIGWLTGPELTARLTARRGTMPDPAAEAALELAIGALAAMPRPL